MSFVGIFVGSYPIRCNNELIEWFRVKNMLREVIEQALQFLPNEDGFLWSEELVSYLVPHEQLLRLADGNRRLRLTEAQARARWEEARARRAEAAARQAAEKRAEAQAAAKRAEAAARQAAERRAEALAEKLRSLGVDPDRL